MTPRNALFFLFYSILFIVGLNSLFVSGVVMFDKTDKFIDSYIEMSMIMPMLLSILYLLLVVMHYRDENE